MKFPYKMKLYYFDIPVRGEPIRLLLHAAKVPFEDIRIKHQDWPKFKDTLEGKQLPILEIDGKRYAQSLAILEYLGQKYDFMPSSPEMIYNVISIINTCEEVSTKMFYAFNSLSPYDEEGKKKLATVFQENDIQVLLGFIEKRLEENESKDFLVGSKYTLADFFVLGLYANFNRNETQSKLWNNFKGAPLLHSYVSKRVKDFSHYYKKTPSKPKLYYLDEPGRAECCRILLRHAGVDYEDVRIPHADWQTMKSKFCLEQVPVWECDGKQYPQTDAIMHLLSMKYGYLPLDPGTMYRVIFICNTVKDLYERFVQVTYGNLPEKKKKKAEEEYCSSTIPLIFSILERCIKDNITQEFVVGAKYTMADFFLLGVAKWLIFNPATESKYEKAFESAPILKTYLLKRLSDFPQSLYSKIKRLN